MTPIIIEPGPFVLRLPSAWPRMDDREFFELCRANPDWRIEQTAEGDIIVMPSTGGETGGRNSALGGECYAWAKLDGTGLTFDSSTVFRLPNGAKRSPDLSWVRRDRWEALTPEARRTFPPLCPDFVAELRSPSDSLEMLQAKMEEYLANDARLGWLIDPEQRKVYVYRPSAPVVCLDDPQQVSGDPVLPGFVLEMRAVWGD
jgi:Uma2 family endonuclease